MAHNILITGGSGYLGGTLLARWKSANLPPYNTLYALVRTEDQAQKVKQYGAEPLVCNISDHEQVTRAIIDRKITVIYFLIDAFWDTHQKILIKTLGEVKKQTGEEVHFLQTAGAKHFSRHAGIYFDEPLLDTDLKLYIFAPCIVYGEGEGFGNRTSIQDVAIVKAAKKARQVYKVDLDNPTWPVCHIIDTTTLYLQILRQILLGNDIGHNKNGFFLAASGSVPWNDIYSAIAKALAKRDIVDDEKVEQADGPALAKMAGALQVTPSAVPVQLGGECMFTAVHGHQIGWKPQYPPEHILEAADAEVELILKSLEVDDSKETIQ